MRTLLEATAILLVLALMGCAPGGLFLTDASNMTPEQLQQYKDLGYDAIRCATITGPPGGGTVTSVTVPKGRAASVKFVGCQVQTIEVGGAP